MLICFTCISMVHHSFFFVGWLFLLLAFCVCVRACVHACMCLCVCDECCSYELKHTFLILKK